MLLLCKLLIMKSHVRSVLKSNFKLLVIFLKQLPHSYKIGKIYYKDTFSFVSVFESIGKIILLNKFVLEELVQQQTVRLTLKGPFTRLPIIFVCHCNHASPLQQALLVYYLQFRLW